MEKITLRITNMKNGLSKLIEASDYSMLDLEKTFEAYEPAGFLVKIIRS